MDDITQNLKANETKGEKIKVFCSKCRRETNHVVLQSVDCDGFQTAYDQGGIPEYVVNWSDNYQIIQCKGCEDISFRQVSFFSEDVQPIGPYEDSDGTSVWLYPKRSGKTRTIKDYYNVPSKIRRIYRETIECFNNDLLTLCAAGLRAIIDGICADQKVFDVPVKVQKKDGTVEIQKRNDLATKIGALCDRGILTQSNANILHEHRVLGNEAVHELDQPSTAELELAIEIMELTLDTLYEMPDKANELRRLRAKRKK